MNQQRYHASREKQPQAVQQRVRNAIGRLTIMFMACLFLSGAAHAAWDISITPTPANDPIIVCLGSPVTVVLNANITGTEPKDTAECKVSGPTWKWSDDGTGTSASTTITKTFDSTGNKTLKGTVEAKYTYANKPGMTSPCPAPETKPKSITINVKVVQVKIKTPKGDPTKDPGDDGSNDTNEWVYNGASPGVCTKTCEAKDTPDADKLRWKIADVGNIKAKWNPHVAGDEHTGKGLSSTATFTGLPADNADFGAKTITLTMEGVSCNDSKTVEVFFGKTETNHPGGQAGSPNWFHYWRQATGTTATLVWAAASGDKYGEVKAMTKWAYAVALAPKAEVTVYNKACGEDEGEAKNSIHGKLKTTGIATFWDTITHEPVHVKQVKDADALLAVAANTPWENGWSWNAIGNDNHWSIGVDGKPGKIMFDDDGDGVVDNLIKTGPGEVGKGGAAKDDVDLDTIAPAAEEWPDAWPLPVKPAGGYAGDWAVEQGAYDAEPDDDTKFARSDWGAPGKNYKTLDKYDD